MWPGEARARPAEPFRCGLACALAVVACGTGAAASARAAGAPSCAGRPATQCARSTYIVAKPHAVLVTGDTPPDPLILRRGARTRHVICGGPG